MAYGISTILHLTALPTCNIAALHRRLLVYVRLIWWLMTWIVGCQWQSQTTPSRSGSHSGMRRCQPSIQAATSLALTGLLLQLLLAYTIFANCLWFLEISLLVLIQLFQCVIISVSSALSDQSRRFSNDYAAGQWRLMHMWKICNTIPLNAFIIYSSHLKSSSINFIQAWRQASDMRVSLWRVREVWAGQFQCY